MTYSVLHVKEWSPEYEYDVYAEGRASDNSVATVADARQAGITRGTKFDGDKPRMELLTAGCPLGLLEVGKVLTFGSKKYADHNWKHVPNAAERYQAALMRHLLAYNTGEAHDPETGLSHLAHAACCVLFMLELELTK